jgi:hypothetical protein
VRNNPSTFAVLPKRNKCVFLEIYNLMNLIKRLQYFFYWKMEETHLHHYLNGSAGQKKGMK